MDAGLPTKSIAFLEGQDVLYAQFNEISFYVEDEDQENFYFILLKKLFGDIKFEKIFPLCGKKHIIDASKLTATDKTKVYILDKDFDDILGVMEHSPNLFYLEKYSIENYLIEETAIHELIIEEKPKLKITDLISSFSLDEFKKETQKLFREVLCSYLVIQKYNLGIKNIKNDPARFCNLHSPSSLRKDEFNQFKTDITKALAIKDKRLKVDSQIKHFQKYFSSKATIENVLDHIPGKYILQFLKSRLKFLFLINSFNNISLESLSIRLLRKCKLLHLTYLKEKVVNFINL